MTSTEQPSASHHLTVALRLAALGWLAMAVQEMLLFVRPNPYGEPYVGLWTGYLLYALAYNLLGVMGASAPSILFWLVRYRRPIAPAVARRIHQLQLGLLLVTVVLDHLDNEVMRFMGIHLTYGLLRTYYKVNAWGDDMGQIILGDRGGPGLPFLILLVVPLAVVWAGWRAIRSKPMSLAIPRWAGIALVAVPVLVPLMIHQYRNPGSSRKYRVQPEIVTLYAELGESLAEGDRPSELEALAREYQDAWFRQSGDTAWRFTDPERPLVREPLMPATPAAGHRWNVIFIQLETFRGWNTGILRPDVTPSATPFLDRFARDTASAFWRRHLSFGPPTVSGFISAHCSVKPHSRGNITASFTYTSLDCLPAVLRRHGYRAELFTGFDPDWDNQGIWMRRWYNDFHYYDDIKNLDRAIFRRAAERIRALGRGPQPFMATLISISNHIPFRARRMGPGEERFDLDPDRPVSVAIRNTMRYTDDVVRELIESLEPEPWFARTLVIITGDHGYDLGERGTSGQNSGWREAVWVPLVIHGAHPRLPRGGRDEPATLLDIAPTVADLLGIRDPTPWMGSSLAAAGHTGSPFAAARDLAIFGEQGRFSMVVDPRTGKPRLFDAIEDPLQRRNISAAHPGVADALRRQAEHERRLVDYLVEANLVWRAPGS
jgi:hypothetical protein